MLNVLWLEPRSLTPADPGLPAQDESALRRKIVERALDAIQTDVDSPTIFVPIVSFTSG